MQPVLKDCERDPHWSSSQRIEPVGMTHAGEVCGGLSLVQQGKNGRSTQYPEQRRVMNWSQPPFPRDTGGEQVKKIRSKVEVSKKGGVG